MTNSTEEPAKTGRCQPCKDRDRHLDEADARMESGLSPFHPLVSRAVARARVAEYLADHPMTLSRECPHESLAAQNDTEVS